jgi:serine/threonine-protein kinase
MDIEQLAGTRLGNYEIESLLGKGGMGVVYKARQISLNRPVALKILPPNLSSDVSFVKRFKREAEAIAQLDHSNIVQIHDIAKSRGLHFFSMQYVEGRTLDAVLKEEGRLNVDEAVRIITQAAQGIEHAHKNGIIHRDIKPSNIILDETGKAKVMDFGLARTTEERSKLTQSGTLMGTLDYMSPEQCQGDDLDGRTDIYSLGVVLYEALTGRTPFEAPNEVALLNKIINEDPPDIQTHNPDVPISVSKIIFRTMAKDKAIRYSEIGELIEDLRSCAAASEPAKATTPLGVEMPQALSRGRRIGVLATAAILVCLGIVGIVFLRQPRTGKPVKLASPTASAKEKTYSSIAVLPFVNMSADPDQEYFCDGISEELINALTQFENLRVIARTSAFSFKGQKIDIREIGKKLDVETVLEGSVRKAGNQLRITAQLVDVSTNDHLWSERYDREMKDIFAVQDEITLSIVRELKGKLLGSEKARSAKNYDVNTEAYNLYLRGTYNLYKLTPEGMKKGEAYFKQALEKDPGFAPAYVGLADLHTLLPFFAFTPPEKTFSRARESALKALEIDDTLAAAHSALAQTKMFYDWDWEGAKKGYMRAIELSPGNAGSHIGYAYYLLFNSHFDEAIKEIETSIKLDPINPGSNFAAGLIHYYAGHNDQAIEFWKTAVLMAPDFPFAHLWLGREYSRKSMYEEALAECKKESDINPWARSFTGTIYVEMEKKDKAQQLLDELIEQSKQAYVPPTTIAWLYLALGENDKGFMWLDKAYEAGDFWLSFIKIDRAYDNVRSDPRYIAMLKKIGLDR